MYWVGERCIRGETVAQAAVECIEDVYKRQALTYGYIMGETLKKEI